MLSLFKTDSSFSEALPFIEEAIPMGLFSMELEDRAMWWSAGVFRLLGLSPTTHAPTADIFGPMLDPRDRVTASTVDAAIRSATPFHLELRLINPSGRARWVKMYAEFLRDEDGRPVRMIGSLLDNSASQEARSAASIFRRRLCAISAMSTVVWWTAAPDGKVEQVEGWETLTGQPTEDIREGGWLTSIHTDDADRVWTEQQRAIAHGESYETEMRVRLKSGNYRWMVARCTPVRDESHRIVELVGALTDIHDTREWPIRRDEIVSGAQIRGGRAIANLSVRQLSKVAGVPISTIRRIEEFDGLSRPSASHLAKIRKALEEAGVEFVFPPVGQPAVRLGSKVWFES